MAYFLGIKCICNNYTIPLTWICGDIAIKLEYSYKCVKTWYFATHESDFDFIKCHDLHSWDILSINAYINIVALIGVFFIL